MIPSPGAPGPWLRASVALPTPSVESAPGEGKLTGHIWFYYYDGDKTCF